MSLLALIACDGPGCPATTRACVRGVSPDESEVLAHRREVAAAGWSRMRPHGAKEWGDYCPRCAAAIRAAWEEEAVNVRR